MMGLGCESEWESFFPARVGACVFPFVPPARFPLHVCCNLRQHYAVFVPWNYSFKIILTINLTCKGGNGTPASLEYLDFLGGKLMNFTPQHLKDKCCTFDSAAFFRGLSLLVTSKLSFEVGRWFSPPGGQLATSYVLHRRKTNHCCCSQLGLAWNASNPPKSLYHITRGIWSFFPPFEISIYINTKCG